MKQETTTLSSKNKRIAKNTVYLYARKIVTLLVSLYSSRVLLEYLGVDDFGLYGLVGSIVIVFNSFRGLFASSVQRFLNVRKESDVEGQNAIFSMGMSIHLVLALAFIVIVEIGGMLLLPTLNIHPDKFSVAVWVLQFSIASAAVSIITVPFDAVLMAREKFDAYALFSIIDSLLRLGVIFLLVISPINRVIFYSILLLLVAIVIRMMNAIYCHRVMPELVKYRPRRDKKLLKEMTQFAGWNFFGNLGFSLTNEGVNFILNLFGGIVANAARTIAVQVNQAVGTFTRDINVTFIPQIMKSYASGDLKRFYSLQFFSAKASLSLVLMIGVPILALTPQILQLWLENPPLHSENFVRAILLYLVVRSIHGPFDVAFKSANKLKKYQIAELTVMVMNLPVSWLLLHFGLPLYSAFIAMGVLEMVNVAVISVVAHRELDFRSAAYFKSVLLPGLIIIGLSCAAAFLIPIRASGLLSVLGWAAIYLVFTLGLCLAILFSGAERSKILTIVHLK